jgi:hypothetical protein
MRHVAVDAERKRAGERSGWQELDRLGVPLVGGGEPFRAYELQVDRGEGWSGSVTAYVAASGRLVAVDR